MRIIDLHRRRVKKIGFTTDYQEVLDYATANGITTPSESQNFINNKIIEDLKAANKWVKLDIFYYFRQHAGLEEFCKLNWRSPGSYTLTDVGLNPVSFIPNQGFQVDGGNNQIFSTQYTPRNNAINCLPGSSSVFFKSFNVVDSSTAWVAGSSSSPFGDELDVRVGTNFRARTYEAPGGSNDAFPVGINELNAHFSISDFGTDKFYSRNGGLYDNDLGQNNQSVLLPDLPIYIFGYNYRGTDIFESSSRVGLEYYGQGASMHDFENQLYRIINHSQELPVLKTGDYVFGSLNSSLNTFSFIQVTEAVKFPSLNTTKPFLITYSTDHAFNGENDGAIAWAEADTPSLKGIIERGEIVRGYQSEMANLQLFPNDINGETVHLYYHPDVTHPDSGGYQQTRLLTRVGGDLHNSSGWTDRGKILGLRTDLGVIEDHTGYLITYNQADNSFLGIHNTRQVHGTTENTIPKIGISVNSGNNYVWNRETSYIDNTSFMPPGRQFHMSPVFYFERNGVQYAVGRNEDYAFTVSTCEIGIAQCDGNYIPKAFLGNISDIDSGRGNSSASCYIDPSDPDTLHIYYVMGKTKIYHRTWDLSQLVPDTEAPSIPNGLVATNTDNSSTVLSWNPSTDSTKIMQYKVFKDGVFYSATEGTSLVITGLSKLTTYSFTVSALDGLENESDQSLPCIVETEDTFIPRMDALLSSYSYEFSEGDIVDSISGNNGINNTATRGVSGKIGNAIQFTGEATSQFTIPKPIITGKITLNTWVKLPVHTPSVTTKAGFMDLNTANFGSHYPYTNGVIYMSLFTSLRKTIGSGIIADRTQWHMISVTADTNTDEWKFYQNAQLVHTGNVGTLTLRDTSIIGKSIGAYYADMLMDETRLWDDVLTQSELEIEFNNGNGITI